MSGVPSTSGKAVVRWQNKQLRYPKSTSFIPIITAKIKSIC
jgi:hypothetical protein